MKKLACVIAMSVLIGCGGSGSSTSSFGAAPEVTTLPPTSVGAGSATLNGSVNPNGVATQAWFEYGTDRLFSTFRETTRQDMGSGTASRSISAALTGLPAGTSHFYRLAAGNGSATSRGSTRTFVPGGSGKAITAFWFSTPAATGAVNEDAKTISVAVPAGTIVTALVASFTTTGVSVRVGSTVQVSGSTPNNFSAAVKYVVTAADNTTATYNATVSVAPPAGGALIVDHTSVAAFDRIPAQWLAAAKQLTMHYVHTSHGGQIVSGLEAMELAEPAYGVAIGFYSTVLLPPQEDPPVFRMYRNALDPTGYWSTEAGRALTRSAAGTGWFGYSMFAWCGEMTGASAATVQQYLDTMNAFETEFPSMRFIYMTGHTDGTDTPSTPTSLKYNNNLIRQYAIANNKVLFDFADIESYDPAGNYYLNDYEGNCTWCAGWCDSHPEDCINLASSCAHTHPYICKLKAKAFWYMMARLAGWDGN